MLKSGRGFAAFLLVFTSIIALSNPSAAGEQLLFDKVLTIGNWYVHASRHSFNAADARQARIKISKNTPDKEIQRGFFVFNGAFTFLRDFLTGDERVYEKDVTLQAANTLFVFLLGSPGAAVSMQILQGEEPSTAPEIKTFTAEPTAIKRGESAKLTWQAAHADSCVIEPDIGAADPNGSVSVAPTHTTIYTLTAEGIGDPATARVTVTIENSAPKADSQEVTTDEDGAVNITLTATDVDGDSLTYVVTAQPGKGTLSGTPPVLTYTPGENYNGPDAFSFTASDTAATSGVATVNITVKPVNDQPQADDDQATTNEDTPVVISNLLANDTDVDNDSLTITAFSRTANGQLEQQQDGSVAYTPNLNFYGEDSFTYTISDGNEGTATATVRITVVPINDAPVAQAGLDKDVFVGDTVTLDGSGCGDVDEDPLNFSWTFVATPAGSSAALSDPSAVNPTFTPDIAGNYKVQLVVNDDSVNSLPDQVMIIANPRMVNVPNLVDMNQPAAEAAIKAAKLRVGAIASEHSETVAEGHVISQSPVDGTSVVENSVVDLTTSLGSENQPPTVSISASPSSISQGGSTTLAWTSLRAESAHIDNQIGAVSVEGSTQVSPEHTTTYTVTVTGPAGSANARVTVEVIGSPDAQPEGSYGEQYEDLIPPDASVEQYDPERFSLITGLVHDINQLPLPGVMITVHSHAEYGSVTTDDQGRFSIPR